MRNVNRLIMPTSLKNNSVTWTNILLNEIAKVGDVSKVEDKYFRKYNKPDVRRSLKNMYKNLCCYCERDVGRSGHIEHRKPMKPYPNETYNWDNMNLACADCNEAKGNKYDEAHPILDYVNDVPISDNLEYHIYKISAISDRGRTTRDHVLLNREDLNEQRQEILFNTLEIIGEINKDPLHPSMDIHKEKLNEQTKNQFGVFIKYIIDRYKQW